MQTTRNGNYFKLLLAFVMLFAFAGCSEFRPQTEPTLALTLPTGTITPSPSNVPNQPSITPTYTIPTSTVQTCGNQVSGPKVFVDEHPAIAIRQGPGCEYPELQTEAKKTDPLQWFDVLGKNGDWLQLDLCSNNAGWVFAPGISSLNRDVSIADLQTLPPPSTPVAMATFTPLNNPEVEMEKASDTLVTFYEFLYTKDYQEAVKIFSGGYGITISWNSDIDPLDYPNLLMRACEWNGFQCFLRVKRIVSEEQISRMEYLFMVEFMNEDGSLYQRAIPQQNQTPNVMEQFPLHVVRDCNGKFFVTDWPFYEQYGP